MLSRVLGSDADSGTWLLQNHRFQYNEAMPVESTTQALCDLSLAFGEDDEEGGMVRPAAAAALMALCS